MASLRTAGPLNHSPAGAVHCNARRESKTHTAFRPALGCEGRARKAALGQYGRAD